MNKKLAHMRGWTDDIIVQVLTLPKAATTKAVRMMAYGIAVERDLKWRGTKSKVKFATNVEVRATGRRMLTKHRKSFQRLAEND